MRIRISGFPALLVYLAIGALTHLLFVGATFDWGSAWTWITVFGWPVLVFAGVLLLMAVIALVLFLLSTVGLAQRRWERR